MVKWTIGAPFLLAAQPPSVTRTRSSRFGSSQTFFLRCKHSRSCVEAACLVSPECGYRPPPRSTIARPAINHVHEPLRENVGRVAFHVLSSPLSSPLSERALLDLQWVTTRATVTKPVGSHRARDRLHRPLWGHALHFLFKRLG